MVEPNVCYAVAFLRMAEAFQAAGEPRYEQVLPLLRSHFGGFVDRLRNSAGGQDLPPGHVQSSEFWLLDCSSASLVGIIRLRHILNAYLEERGGHIGYAVHPAARRRGYGTWMLSTLLAWLREPAWQQAHGLALTRVLVTCHRENIASARVIVTNGGQLENQVWSEGEWVSRYWISLLPDTAQ